jgi:hypothetical protein
MFTHCLVVLRLQVSTLLMQVVRSLASLEPGLDANDLGRGASLARAYQLRKTGWFP